MHLHDEPVLFRSQQHEMYQTARFPGSVKGREAPPFFTPTAVGYAFDLGRPE